MIKFKQVHFILFGLIFLSSFTLLQKKQTSTEIKLLTKQTYFSAGSLVALKFSKDKNTNPLLYCANSYGSILIKPTIKNEILFYKLPESFSKKRGVIFWKLNNTKLSGEIKITPLQNVKTLETYIGPPSIKVGKDNFSMLTVIPTDSLDNPLPENTLVTVHEQFLNQKKSYPIYTKNLIAYKNLYAPSQSGRMLISSESLNENSKEFTVIVYPENPTDFTITAKRNHAYADGNQITTFYTSIIKDKQNNVVNDGTFVNFFIQNEKGNILRTSGVTIKGIANAIIIHPDYKSTWKIKAYVDGMAESNSINLTYLQALNDFKVSFSDDNRTLKIGPLQSFMQQMIPDGLEVQLLIYKNKKRVHTEIATSYNGFVSFQLNTAVYPSGIYTFKITTAGLEKKYKNIKIW